ncbi:MAG: hypothetical protein Ct9H90mP13_11850 [Pseudomonadota bacterium]|nr:MAG: hypothetical protein Ct9H90mP13_11850 [Pseudomonadota bacterium]
MEVSSDEGISKAFDDLRSSWSNFDIMVHSIAFAPTEELKGSFIESVTEKALRPLMKSALLALLQWQERQNRC